jgi:hypothetical protein
MVGQSLVEERVARPSGSIPSDLISQEITGVVSSPGADRPMEGLFRVCGYEQRQAFLEMVAIQGLQLYESGYRRGLY